MRSIHYLCLLICALMIGKTTHAAQPKAAALHLLTFFVERSPYMAPDATNNIDTTHILKKASDPYSFSRMIIKGHIKSLAVAGLAATYFGWWTYSDTNGQIVFPLQHEGSQVNVIVTQTIQPILTHGTIVEGFAIPHDAPYAFYEYKRTGSKKNMAWSISKINLPANRRIPQPALVVFAKPKETLIPEGTVPAITSDDLILPTLIVAHDARTGIDTLHFMAINKYFSPVTRIMKRATARYAFKIT